MYYIKSNNDVKIAVYDYNPQSDKTVFFIHGWPLSHKIFEYQTERLTELGFRVIEIDIRGFGKSDTPASGYTYDQMADDVYSVILTLRLSQIILAGFSMGGAIAIRYMKKYGGYGIKQLFLLSAAAPVFVQTKKYPYGQPPETVNSMIDDVSTKRPDVCHDFAHTQLLASSHSDNIKNWFEDVALSASGIGTLHSLMALRDENLQNDFSSVNVPTIIIHGAKDIVVPVEFAEVQHQNIPSSKIYILDNSGHAVIYDELKLFNDIFISAIRL